MPGGSSIASVLHSTREASERAYLVAAEVMGRAAAWDAPSSLEELAQLADTAGAIVVGRSIQRLERPNPTYYIGKGKVQEVASLKPALDYDLVIFDDELSPSQQRNLEKALTVKVIDRTALILDIFAQHAHTREGRLQVELAQHEYLLPRLVGQWAHLERLGGGIGTRGPGETQLETDRRLVRERIRHLKEELEAVRRQRSLYRRRRARQGLPVVSLVGYTNAGKSTLMGALSGAQVLIEDKLFATLDPLTRRIRLPGGDPILLTDTVGFLQKLPHQLVAAFRATLEELSEADLLLHVLDITHPNAAEQYQTVEETLAQLGLAPKPRLAVLNKLDRLRHPTKSAISWGPRLSEGDGRPFRGFEELIGELGQPQMIPEVVPVSALKGWGLEELQRRVEGLLRQAGAKAPLASGGKVAKGDSPGRGPRPGRAGREEKWSTISTPIAS